MGTVSGEGNNSARAPLKGLHAIFAVVNQTTLCRPILALPPTDVIISHTLSDFQIIPASPIPPLKKARKKKELQRRCGVFLWRPRGAGDPWGGVRGARHACAAAPAPVPVPPAARPARADVIACNLGTWTSPPPLPARPGSAPRPGGAAAPGDSEHGPSRPRCPGYAQVRARWARS